MNIRDKIIEWQGFFVDDRCCSDAEREECDRELEMVLFAIDTLVGNKATNIEVVTHEGEPRISLSRE